MDTLRAWAILLKAVKEGCPLSTKNEVITLGRLGLRQLDSTTESFGWSQYQ
jgi:hypothetical protein